MSRSRPIAVAVLASLMVGVLFAVSPWGPLENVLWPDATIDVVEGPIELETADVEIDAPRPALAGLPEIDPDAKRGPVIVTVLGAHDVPLVGVPVRLVKGKKLKFDRGMYSFEEEQEAIASVTTDAVGIAVFADVPYDRTHLVGVRAGIRQVVTEYTELGHEETVSEAEVHTPISPLVSLDDVTTGASFMDTSTVGGSGVDFHAVVDGPEVELEARVGLPFEARVESSETGRAVGDATWRAGLVFVDDAGGTPDGETAIIAAELSQHMNIPMEVSPGRGNVLVGDPMIEGYFHPEAKRVVAVIPVRPEIDVAAVPPEGVMLARDLSSAEVTGPGTMMRATLDGFGRVLVAGVPHMQGETISISVAGTDGLLYVGTARIGIRPDPVVLQLASIGIAPPAPQPDEGPFVEEKEVLEGVLELDEEEVVVEEPEIVDEEIASSEMVFDEVIDWVPVHTDYYSASSITGTNLEPKDWYTVERKRDGPSGNVLLQIFRPDGTPAAGALANLDDHPDFLYARKDGKIFFQGYPPGEYRLSVLGAGAALEIPVTVEDGKTTTVVHHATWGGKVDLTVLDEDGNPVPYARFDVGQTSEQFWTCVENGVQRLDHFTDKHGKRLIQSVEIGQVTIQVSFGSRSASREITVKDGQTTELVLRLGDVQVHLEESFDHAPAPPPPPVLPPDVEDDR